MRSVRDLVGVAVAGLTARWSRTLLIMLGPIIGVSAIVAAVGLTESAKGDLQETLAALGDNLIRGEAAASFSADAPIFTEDVVERVNRLATVEGSTATKAVSGIITTPTRRPAATTPPSPHRCSRPTSIFSMSCRSNSCQVDGSTPSTRTLPPAPPWSGSASPTNLASAKETEPSSSTTSTTASSVWWSATRSIRSSTMP